MFPDSWLEAFNNLPIFENCVKQVLQNIYFGIKSMWIYLFWQNDAKTANSDKFLHRVCAQTLKCSYTALAFILLSLLSAIKKPQASLKLGAGIEMYLFFLTENSVPIGNWGGEILNLIILEPENMVYDYMPMNDRKNFQGQKYLVISKARW